MQTAAALLGKYIINRRINQRYLLFVKGRYFFTSDSLLRNCTVIDIGRGGARLMLPKEAIFSKGATIFIEVPSKGTYKPSFKSEIVWFEQIENASIVGAKFSKTLDLDPFKKLF
jgi:hypothetical protein